MNYTSLIGSPRFNYVPCRAQRMLLRRGSGTPQAEQGSCSNFLHMTTAVEHYSHYARANTQTPPHWRLPGETEVSVLRYLYRETSLDVHDLHSQCTVTYSIHRPGRGLHVCSNSTYKPF